MGGVVYGEPLEHRQQQYLPLHRRHFGERFLQPAADALRVALLFQCAEGLLKAVEQGKYAEFGICRFCNELGLLHHDFSAEPDPFVSALLGAGHRARIATQERQRPGNCFG